MTSSARRALVLLTTLASALAIRGQAPPALNPPQSPARESGQYSISGVVLSSTTGRPLDRADVWLEAAPDNKTVAQTRTTEDGHFDFEGLAKAKYGLRGSRRGYITSYYQEHFQFSTAIAVGEGLVSTGLTLQLPPDAVIYGTVTDEAGDPVQQAQVSIYRENYAGGAGNIIRIRSVGTDDLGAYEVIRLEPGDYYLSVTARPWYATRLQGFDGQGNVTHIPNSALDVAFARTFYAGATDSDSATPIPLRAGDRVPVNFTLAAVPALHMTTNVSRPEGRPNPNFSVPTLEQEVFGTMEPVQADVMGFMGNAMGGPTTMEIGGIPPGNYQIEVTAPGGAVRHLSSLNVTADFKLDTTQASPVAAVTGAVLMASGDKLPSGAVVALRAIDGPPVSPTQLDKDGAFEFNAIAPGKYELVVYAPGAALSVRRLTASGAALDGHLLTVGTQPVTIAATLVAGSATITGVAQSGGKPASGVMVVLVPKDPVGDQAMFRRDQSDSDGTFSLYQVPPGEYTVVAIDDGWELDWAHPAVIAHYLPLGLKVTVPPNTKTFALPAAVQSQTK
jgi:hypothetical protein